MPMTEDVLMIDPPPPLRMAGIAVPCAQVNPFLITHFPQSRNA